MVLSIVCMVVGLVLLTFGAEVMVRGAARLARGLGISSFIVGLTVVAFGTSAPELGGSIQAAFQGQGGLAVGNVVGSNIANVCLILGVTALICPIPVKLNVVRREVPLMFAVCAMGVATMWGGQITRFEGIALMVGLAIYIGRAYLIGRKETGDVLAAAAAKELDAELSSDVQRPWWFNTGLVLAGTVLLVGGSYLLVEGAVDAATRLGVPESVVGLTMVAFGTSVPELWTSVYAALRKESDIAVGNILGSNVFNILAVLGTTATVSPDPLPVDDGMIGRDVWVMLGVCLACVPIMQSRGSISRFEGTVLFGFYLAYITVLYLTAGT